MKKNIIILGLISLLAVSCGDDFLTTHPGDSVSTDLALSTEQDIDNAVNGLYDLMSSYGYYGGTMFFYGDMKGDDMQSSYNSDLGLIGSTWNPLLKKSSTPALP